MTAVSSTALSKKSQNLAAEADPNNLKSATKVQAIHMSLDTIAKAGSSMKDSLTTTNWEMTV